jgi:C4-dicarboxylate-specific signal transduction histidine kinase
MFPRPPMLPQFRVGRHLAVSFTILILMMLTGNGLLLWQLRQVRSQVDILRGLDRELIEVLRVHGDLFSFYVRLGIATRSEDPRQLLQVSDALRRDVLAEAQRTASVFHHLPAQISVDPTVFPTIETIEQTLPSHLDAIRALAASGQWALVRDRTDKQVQQLEFLSSPLVKDVAHKVETQRTQAAEKITSLAYRILWTAVLTGFVTLLTAVFFGWATALRILELQMAASAERKRAEQSLRQAQADLTRANRLSSMGELTASLAHEVNQPIAAAITDANTCLRWLAREPPDLEEARAAAARVVLDSRRAGEIVKHVRSLFDKDALHHELVDLNGVIQEMVLLLHSEAALFSILMRTDLAASLPQVLGDRTHLQQVLMNLMINSFDALKDADGTRELTIGSQRGEDGQVLVSVSDTGMGIPPQHADRIFDAFFTTKTHGTGMGLRISRSIIESHGGRLWAADSPPRGAKFCFTLPTGSETGDSMLSQDRLPADHSAD